MNGWVKLHRVWSEWQHIDKPNVCHVMAYFLSIAQHDHFTYNGFKLRPGQLVISQRPLAEKLGLSHRQLRTVLSILEATHETTHVATQHGTVVTLLKWGKFQDSDHDTDTRSDTPIDTHKQEYNKQTIHAHARGFDPKVNKPFFKHLLSEMENSDTMRRFFKAANLDWERRREVVQHFADHVAGEQREFPHYGDFTKNFRSYFRMAQVKRDPVTRKFYI